MAETNAVREKRLKAKKDAFKWGMSYSIGISARNEREEYRIPTEERTLFQTGPVAVYTPSDQEVETAIRLAEWLLEE